ncbi:MAG: hypothetical protein WCK56_14600, partial [Alcaligenaceae bacterium]
EIGQPLNIISMVMDKILFETARTEIVDVEFLKIKSDKIFENITRIRDIIDHVRAFSRNRDDYVNRIRGAALGLIESGFLLRDDAAVIVQAAAATRAFGELKPNPNAR